MLEIEATLQGSSETGAGTSPITVRSPDASNVRSRVHSSATNVGVRADSLADHKLAIKSYLESFAIGEWRQ